MGGSIEALQGIFIQDNKKIISAIKFFVESQLKDYLQTLLNDWAENKGEITFCYWSDFSNIYTKGDYLCMSLSITDPLKSESEKTFIVRAEHK
jgi:hypothetical protein